MTPGTAPRNLSEETIAQQVRRLAGPGIGGWPEEIWGSKIEPIEDENT